MDGYKRQISYLDYMENGEKTGNAGFVKAEENNGKTRIEVRVKNLPAAVSGEVPLLEEGGGELGRISLNKGAGSCCLVWEGKTEGRGIERVKSGGLQIELPGGRMLKTVWKEPVWVLVQKEEAAEEKENAGEEEKDKGASEIVPAIEYPETNCRHTTFLRRCQIARARGINGSSYARCIPLSIPLVTGGSIFLSHRQIL